MEYTIAFDPPADPWSTNQERQMHHRTRHTLSKAWKETARDEWIDLYGTNPIEGYAIVQIEIPFKTKRRRDNHNYCGTTLKSIIDGLVEAGAFPDDNTEYVGHREPILKQSGQVVVTVTT